LLLPLLAIPAIWPLLKMGLPLSADGTLHLLRVVLLDHHISNGVLYPRWVPELFTGLGYPVFNFYSPLAYYLAELLHLIGLDFVAALIASFAVLIVFSGFGMYRLARDVLGSRHTWAALVAATAYMYAPYLLTNVYIRGAIAEVGAQAWLPWVFWSARDVDSRASIAVCCGFGTDTGRVGTDAQYHPPVYAVDIGCIHHGSVGANRQVACPAGLDSCRACCRNGCKCFLLGSPDR